MRLTIRTYNYCEDSSFIPPEAELIKKVKAGLNVFNEQRFKGPFESGEIVQEVNFNNFNYGIRFRHCIMYLKEFDLGSIRNYKTAWITSKAASAIRLPFSSSNGLISQTSNATSLPLA